jgi:thymidylate synthase
MSRVVVIEAPTLGEGWLAVSRAILEGGALATYDGHATRELAHVSVAIADPSPDDEVIARLGDPQWLDWMHANFFDRKDVAELGDAKSYAARLFDYAGGGRDQLAWVVDRLRADPECRSATITTFQPLTDTSYVPCVSMLDFWLRDGAVELVVYAHSLDFGKKAYGNLVELARLQHRVADELAAATGALVVHAKSAHVYEPEWSAMAAIAGAVDPAAASSSPAKGASNRGGPAATLR